MGQSGSAQWSVWSWVTELLIFGVVPLVILVLNVLVIAETRRLSADERRLHVSVQMTSHRPLTSSMTSSPPRPVTSRSAAPPPADRRASLNAVYKIHCLFTTYTVGRKMKNS